MPKLIPKHRLLIRITHWLNVPVMAVMIWSGLLIYWAYDPYQIVVGGFVLFKFFPEWFYRELDLEYGLGAGMAYHFAFAWFFAANGLVYLGTLIRTGEWRHLVPNRRSFREALHVVLHDLKIRKQPLPIAKYNAAQRFAYTGALSMGAGSLLTGLAILKPTQLWWLTTLFGGYQIARLLHFALAIGFMLFIFVHLAQVARAGWNNFRAMITGFELVNRPQENHHVNRTTTPVG